MDQLQTFQRGILIEAHYCPCIAYFSLLDRHRSGFIEAQEHFNKGSYRNSCFILGPNKVLRLSVPILHNGKKRPLENLQIDYSQKWTQKHWRAVYYAYKNAPYFEHIAPYYKAILNRKHPTLLALNLDFINSVIELLNLPITLQRTKFYQKQPRHLVDYRDKIHPRKMYSNFAPSYRQVFGETFIPNLSMLDLLFCMGRESIEYLKKFQDAESSSV